MRRAVPSDELRRLARAKGLRGDRLVVYAGAVHEAACLVEAAQASGLWSSDAGLALVAFGGSSDDREALERAVAASQGRAVLLPPVEGRDRLLSLLAGADAAVVLYNATQGGANVALATPNKLYDAFAAGLPVVTNDLPGPMHEALEAGVAVACEPRGPASIAAAVDALLAEREVFAASVRRLFDARFLDGRHLREAVRAVGAL
jgi:glycosyltransferase involved in cell wall biosynthesis